MQKIDVIVPVYNEEEILPVFYQRLMNVPVPIHPIFIDNGSTDKSLEILESFADATIIRHSTNEGYGASLRDGMRAATAPKIVIIDADCEYPPECIPELLDKLDVFTVVYASRFLQKQDTKMPKLKVLGNKIISQLFNLLFKQNLTDLYTGCKAFRRDVIFDLEMNQNGFEHVLEIAARLAKRKHSIGEVHVTFSPRGTGVSKMSHFRETTKYLLYLAYYYIIL